jgi:hypothetical protein
MATAPGIKKVANALYSARMARIRRAPIGPNSPLEIMLGEVAPTEPIQFVYASKSKVKAMLILGSAKAVILLLAFEYRINQT